MISEKALNLYIWVLHYASKYHFVPHYFQRETGRLVMKTEKQNRVYLNNFLAILYTSFIISQYFLANELLEIYKGFVISALNLVLTIQLLTNLIIFQNIFLGEETLEVWNNAYFFLRRFERMYKRKEVDIDSMRDLWLYLVALGVVSFPGVGIIATIVCCFVPHLPPFITSAIYTYKLSWKLYPFLVTFQLYVFLQNAALIAEGLTRYYLFAQSADVLVKEPRPGIRSKLTKTILRTQPHIHNLFLCMKYLTQRINWTFGRFLLPAHLLIIIALSIYANCATLSYTSSSSLGVDLLRKVNTFSFSMMSFIYILIFGIIVDNISKNFEILLKKWRVQANRKYYKKAFRAIRVLSLKIGDFAFMTRFTSMIILISITRFTGMLLIQIMKNKHVR